MKIRFEQPPIIRQIPVLRILIPFLCGITISLFYVFPFNVTAIIIAVSLILFFLSGLLKGMTKWKLKFLPGVFITWLFLWLGIIVVGIHSERNRPRHFANFKAKYFCIAIDDALVEHTKSIKTTAKVLQIFDGTKWLQTEGKILLYFEKSKEIRRIKYGDHLLLQVKTNEIAGPGNPEEFDYKKFLAYKQIYNQAYVKTGQWKLLLGNDGNPFIAKALEWRAIVTSMLQKEIKDEQACAVAVALIVGDDDAIDPELMQAYSSSGTLHVLSVSGMHVGVIYLILAAALSFMEKNKWLKHLYFPLIMILIWAYAMLSGFSSSVLRSAMMLSLVITGKWIHAKSPILNTLAVSLLVLLCWNPFMLTEAGFQLSYLAVFGIAYLHPMLLPKVTMPNNFLHKTWELTSVSICAQIVTAPISLYYFHQFPNLFILSNLLVIPLTTLAIYLSVLSVVISFVPYLGAWVAFADAEIIAFVNRSVLWMEKIPCAVTSGISITVVECILLYLLILFGVSYLIKRQFMPLAMFLVVAILISCSQLLESYSQRNQEVLIAYSVPKHLAFGYIKGREQVLVADSAFLNDEALKKRCLQNFWFERGVRDAMKLRMK